MCFHRFQIRLRRRIHLRIDVFHLSADSYPSSQNIQKFWMKLKLLYIHNLRRNLTAIQMFMCVQRNGATQCVLICWSIPPVIGLPYHICTCLRVRAWITKNTVIIHLIGKIRLYHMIHIWPYNHIVLLIIQKIEDWSFINILHKTWWTLCRNMSGPTLLRAGTEDNKLGAQPTALGCSSEPGKCSPINDNLMFILK